MFEPHGSQMTVSIRAPAAETKWIRLHWKHRVQPGALCLGDAWERAYGNLEWRKPDPVRVMPWYFLVSEGSTTSGVGVKTGCAAMASWSVGADEVTLALDVRCGGRGVELRTRTLNAVAVVARDGAKDESAATAAHSLCRMLCDSPRLPADPVYGGNNWYHAYGRATEDQVVGDAARVASWAPDCANRPFMVMDDGWQAPRNDDYNGGPWTYGNRDFPNLPRVAEKMRREGVRPGIWYRPLATVERLPDSCFLNADRSLGWANGGRFLDPTVERSQEILSSDMRRFTLEWGFEMVKHDFSTYDLLGFWGSGRGGDYTADGWTFADRSRTTAEIVADFYRLLRCAAGRTVLLGCNTIGHLSAGLVEVHRTGDDTSGREWERTRKMGVNTMAFRIAQHGAFFAADADCAGITTHIPWHLNRQWLQLLAASGTPLLVSASPDAVGPEQEAALREAFLTASTPQPRCEPLDWMETTCPEHWRFGAVERRFKWS